MFPSIFNIEFLISSIFSSGIASNVVLFIVCIAFMYQISPAGILFVIIFIISPSTPAVPMSTGVSISLFPVGEFFATLICISFCFECYKDKNYYINFETGSLTEACMEEIEIFEESVNEGTMTELS